MKKVITYGTFDLLHYGHINLLKRAKALGDYLVVGVTSEQYDKGRGKLNVEQSLIQRIENVRKSGLADEIIVEEYLGQKIADIKKYSIDIFAIGSDWTGKFDYLKDYCEVVYLERTRGISSTNLRNETTGIVNLGIIGTGRIAQRFIPESKCVSGVNVFGVFNPHIDSARNFAEKNELGFYTDNFDEFMQKVDAVYIASPHGSHFEYAKKSLGKHKHVLCEKPLTLTKNQSEQLYDLAEKQQCVLKEAIKTTYCPGFIHLVNMVKSGQIGKVINVEAAFTKLVQPNCRELSAEQNGGSVYELASYPLLAIVKLLGENYRSVDFITYKNEDNVDLYTKINIRYPSACATAQVGLGAKSEGSLVICGTKGYVYVPAPWWKTEYFEIRSENPSNNLKYFYKFNGDGLRYELSEFIQKISKKEIVDSLSKDESLVIADIIDHFYMNKNVDRLH